MTGGGWNVACGTAPEPLAAVAAGSTIGVTAGEEVTAGVLGAPTDGTVLAEPVRPELTSAGAGATRTGASRTWPYQNWLHQNWLARYSLLRCWPPRR